MTALPPFIAVLNGQCLDVPPLWLMRQAGRYLPEYRALRSEKGGFLDLVYDSDSAAEVTLQPIRRFGFDAAILFSDILVIPHALGQHLWFEEGEGPRLAPKLIESALEALEAMPERLDPIYRTVTLVRAALPSQTPLIGFAGSPWTVATYMLNGAGSKDQQAARLFAYQYEPRFRAIIAAITAQTIIYLKRQIDAGCQVIQLFESWAGNLSPQQFEKWVIAPNAEIVAAIRTYAPYVPIVGFPKGAGAKLLRYVRDVKPDAIGLDETVDPVWAHENLPPELPVQGNLDPLTLVVGGEALDQAILRIISAFRERPHIFNLGHGILPQTPITHVEYLLAAVRK